VTDGFLLRVYGKKPEEAMKPLLRPLKLNIHQLEGSFEYLTDSEPALSDGPEILFLDLEAGELVHPEDEDEEDEMMENGNLLQLPDDIYEGMPYGLLEEFVDSLPDGPLRRELAKAISGKGAFRRFKNIVYGGGSVELRYQWDWFETRRKRERIVEWLRDNDIEPQWDRDIFEAPPRPDKRADLLRAVFEFVRDARGVPGVRRIALLGSLTTSKEIPKDVDLLVEVSDGMSLDKLARLKRQLLGKTLQTGDSCGADVFLCNPKGEYLGRICSWKRCAPGIRQSCHAQNCGRREYLYDDLQNFLLKPAVIDAPPLELWPEIVARTEIPDDVREVLVVPLS
jgi:predicted nucleotidyltransferase